MRLPRAAGILMHPSSLPGPFGIGDFGPGAEAFLDYLEGAGQRWWQILPLGPTGFGNSPYQSYSSYAGNLLLISPERLAEDGLLSQDDWHDYPRLPDDRVDFDAVRPAKEALLRKAFARFQPNVGYDEFVRDNAHWLEDYALYVALKESHDGSPWYEWEPEVASRRPEALEEWRGKLDEPIRFIRFVQYVFTRQWKRVRESCARRKIGLIGDVPIFVAHDSADVWASPHLFHLDAGGMPTVVAGVPPDYFSAEGQMWGNPLYKWEVHDREKYAWWIGRMKATMDRVDLVRLDHFRGFQAYWEIPAGSPNAVTGRWLLGPGIAFLEAMKDGLGGLPLIAEDLGEINEEVAFLRDRFDLPGMRILQFAFNSDPRTDLHLPHSFVNHCIAYTGTHDNDTTVGWFTSNRADTTQSREEVLKERAFTLRYIGTNGREIHWDLIRLAMASAADTAIIPMQDVLGLGADARMNVPGRAQGNWSWRCPADRIDAASQIRLAELTAVYGRWNGPTPDSYRFPTPPFVEPELTISPV